MLIDPSRIRVLGPLSSFAAGFADQLAHQGYTLHSARSQMRLMAHLSRWLMAEELGAGDLRTAEVERFLRARRAAGYTRLFSIKAMLPMLAYLRDLGMAPTPQPAMPCGPVEEVLERYRNYLTGERGLEHATTGDYVGAVRPFLHGRVSPDDVALDLRHLSAADVIAFVVARCAQLRRPHTALGVVPTQAPRHSSRLRRPYPS